MERAQNWCGIEVQDKSGIKGGGWNDGGECEGELSGSWAVDIEAQCAISSLSDSHHLGEQSSEANLGTSLPLPLTTLQSPCHQSLTFFFISVLLVTFPNLSLTSLPVSPQLLYCPQEGNRTEHEISKLCPQWSFWSFMLLPQCSHHHLPHALHCLYFLFFQMSFCLSLISWTQQNCLLF